MHIVTCPIDGKPCDPECPDRFIDRAEGGCLMTMLIEHSDSVLYISRANRNALETDKRKEGRICQDGNSPS